MLKHAAMMSSSTAGTLSQVCRAARLGLAVVGSDCSLTLLRYLQMSIAGQGRVHQCLRFNRNKISDRCRDEEMKLAAVEYRDIRLRPKLNKLCSEERAVYCKVGNGLPWESSKVIPW